MKCRLTSFLSMSCLRYFLCAVCCLLLCLGFGSSTASAYNYDIQSAGSYKFLAGSSRFYNRDGGNAAFSPLSAADDYSNYFPNGIGATTGGTLSHVVLALDTNIPAGSLLSFIWVAPPRYDSLWMSPIQPHEGFGQFVVLDYESITGFKDYNDKIMSANHVFTKVTILTTEPLNAFAFDMSALDTKHSRWFGFFPQTYVKLKSDGSQSVLDAINSSSDQAHQDSLDHQEAINNQTQQDKDQYEQEKQEEQEREESAKNEGNGLLGIFNITILNPFAGIWEIFNSGGCTSIPTIASWVGSDNATYCSWWPQSIRAILTPVFSLAAMILLFGFVVRWLGGGRGIKIDGVDL